MSTLTIGSFSFDLNEVWFIPTSRIRVGQFGTPLFEEITWVIHDVIFAESQAALTAKITARENALRNISGDVTFGTTAHKIIQANTISGIRATMIQYPGGLTSYGGRVFGSGAEYADSSPPGGAVTTFRYLTTTITAEVESPNAYEIAFYQQTYRYNIGGSQFAIQGAFLGLPARFNIMASVPCWAVQQGRIIGLTGYPAAPLPVPSFLVMDPERSWLEPETPKVSGALRRRLFPLAFHYEFRDGLPMDGFANVLPTPPPPSL